MAKEKSKYRDVESMTDEEFEALTREIAGPRMELNEPQCDPRYTERHDNPTPSGGDYSRGEVKMMTEEEFLEGLKSEGVV